MKIVVAPRSAVERLVEEHRPSWAIALRSPGAEAFPIPGVPKERQLHLVMNDIAEDRPGLVSPKLQDVQAVLGFVGQADGVLLVHCYAGISRSTAVAFILAAALEPGRDEAELAAELRALSPMATPNPYLVRLADDALGRAGRMVEAIAGIGRGAEAFEGGPFCWVVGEETPRHGFSGQARE